MKIAIIGAGAMGMVYGAKLKQASNEVIMVDVMPAVVDKLNKKGLELETDDGKLVIPIKASLPNESIEDLDLAIIFTKTIHTEVAMKSAIKNINNDTCVLTLQNGLGNIEIINKFVRYENIIAGVSLITSDILGLGHIRPSYAGHTEIMSANGKQNDMLRNVNKVFNDAGLETYIVPDVFVSIWEKVAFNAAINATSSLCRIPQGILYETEAGRGLLHNVVKETVTVAKACGVEVCEKNVMEAIAKAIQLRKDHFPSMAQDVLNKRPTEVEFINGSIVKKAKEVNIAAPYNETLLALIGIIEKSYDSQVDNLPEQA